MNDSPKKHIRQWWAAHPMTYGDTHGQTTYTTEAGERHALSFGTREFFERADQRFYEGNTPLHSATAKFGKLFDYPRYRGQRVLEIGCGIGCMSMNWVQQGARLNAVDLNPVAIAQTRRRFELFNLSAEIEEMDAQHLRFADNTFDFVYSWGVLHHSPDLQNSLNEMRRVLKSGGRAGVMLYNRHSLLYGYTVAFLEGFVHMENEFLTPLQLASRYGDGAREEGNPHTWPVTRREVTQELFTEFDDVQVKILGTDVKYVFDLAFPLRRWPIRLLKAWGRRWGWSLWITATK